jgi:N-dimethylarginine dimethylaminohydrolase
MPASLQSDCDLLTAVLLAHPRDVFADEATIDAQWRRVRWTARPDVRRAVAEYDEFAAILESAGAALHWLPRGADTTIDSIYVRDAAVVCDRGIVLCRMGKPTRAGEPAALERGLTAAGLGDWPIAGRIEAPGTLEGGDVVWLDPRTIAVGRGYRTNDEGIRQLRAILGDSIDDLVVVPLPHWRGADDVMHLMSLISPVDRDLAVVYAPLLPVPFRERLLNLGMRLVEVPDEEFDTLGTNVLAIGPGRGLMVRGNPRTRAALERAGAEVIEYEGGEISLKGAGGPTCLTRPLARHDGARALSGRPPVAAPTIRMPR